MDGRFFGACFSIFRHKNGAVAPVDYSSTFATAPLFAFPAGNRSKDDENWI